MVIRKNQTERVKMSTKQQRTAWNLTKLCHELDIRNLTEPMSTAIYELAKDAKCVCVQPKHVNANIPTYVIIPESTWNAACNLDKDEFEEFANKYFRKALVENQYTVGMHHEF